MHLHDSTTTQEIRVCEYCHKDFVYIHHKSGKGKFCSRDCGRKGQSQRITVICQYCQQPFEVKRCLLARGEGKFCGKSCQIANGVTPKPLEQRFWANVQKTDTCWLWTGNLDDNGYGRLRTGSRNKSKLTLVHRISYELHFGPIVNDERVCHHCDNPQCVRPDHLFLGTQADNVHDMINKKRNAHGEKASWSKLTEAQVLEIRQRYAQGNILQSSLAREYGICQGTVGEIVRRVIWKHLP